MEFLNRYDKVTRIEIDSLSEQLEIKLPNEYINFLLQSNGGQPKQNNFVKKGINNNIDFDFFVNEFFSIGDEESTDDLLAMFAIYCDKIPEELLPVGSDGVGNIICLGVNGKHFGKVYIWWKDKQANEGEEPSFQNIDFLDSSFDEFLKGFGG